VNNPIAIIVQLSAALVSFRMQTFVVWKQEPYHRQKIWRFSTNVLPSRSVEAGGGFLPACHKTFVTGSYELVKLGKCQAKIGVFVNLSDSLQILD